MNYIRKSSKLIFFLCFISNRKEEKLNSNLDKKCCDLLSFFNLINENILSQAQGKNRSFSIKLKKKNLVKNLKFANLFFIWISFLQEVQQIYLFFRRRKKIIKWYWNMIEIRLEGVGFSKKRVFFGFLLDNFFCFAMKKVVNEKRLLGLKVMNRNALV